MSKITIHDTNILIDLIELDLIEPFLKLDFEFHTTDFVLNEITKSFQKRESTKLKNKFIIRRFDVSELLKLLDIQNNYKNLSIEDISVMELSLSIEGILCTGDKSLKLVAEQRGIEVHGILWIIDHLVKQNIIKGEAAILLLENLKKINSRLPEDLIDNQIESLKENI